MTTLVLNRGIPRYLRIVAWIVVGAAIGLSIAGGLKSFFPWLTAAILLLLLGIILRSKLIMAVMAWVACQNIVLPYLFTRIPNEPSTIWTGLLVLPELAMGLVVILSLVNTRTSRALHSDVWPYVLVYVGLAAIFSLVRKDGLNLFQYLNFLRQVFIPPLFFTAGFVFVRQRPHFLDLLLKSAVAISIVGAIGALVDLFVPTSFWVSWGLGEYWIVVKHIPLASVANGLPLNMFELYGSTLIRRAISIYGDPLAAGYSMAVGFGALIILYVRALRRDIPRPKGGWYVLGASTLIAGILVTYTRAGLLMSILMVAILWTMDRDFRRKVPRTLLVSGVLAVGAVMSKVIKDSVAGKNSSVVVHLRSFLTVPSLLAHPFGLGINATPAPEGLVFWVPWTIGIIPLVAFLVWMAYLMRWTVRTKSVATLAFLISILSTSFVSIELLGDTSCGMAWLILGGCVSLAPISEQRSVEIGSVAVEGNGAV